MRGMYNGTGIGLYIYVLYGTTMCADPSESAHDNLSAHHNISANHKTSAHHNTIAYYNTGPCACPSTSTFPIAIALPSWVRSVTATKATSPSTGVKGTAPHPKVSNEEHPKYLERWCVRFIKR
jgi:hypothetical protein